MSFAPTLRLRWRFCFSGFHAANNALGESGARLLPDFRSLQEELRAWSPFHRFFFSIFRQGHATDERAAHAARFNAALNGLDEVVEVRESNLYTALASGERFDFVTSNPPFMPMLEDVDFPRPGAGGADGLTTLRPLLTQLTDHVEAEFSGVMVCQVLGDNRTVFINRELNELAAREGYQVDAVVSQKQSLTRYQATWMEPSLRLTCPELPEERRAVLLQEWAGAMKAQGASQVYLQLLCFERPAPRPGLRRLSLPRFGGHPERE